MIPHLKKLIILISLFPLALWSQDGTGNWLMYFGSNKVSDKFSIHSEIQYRNHSIAPVNVEQLLLRTGLNYHFAKNAFATAGYAYIGNHEYESERTSPETEEHRIWHNGEEEFFDRNRLYGGLGYQLSDNINLQTGILYQRLRFTGKAFLQFSIVYNTDLRKKKPAKDNP